MTFDKTKCKTIFRSYRLLMKIIRSFEYINAIQFRSNLLELIRRTRRLNIMIYGDCECLGSLINYYEIQCIDVMYERIELEIKKRNE